MCVWEDICYDFGYMRLGNVEHVRVGNVEFSVRLGNVELFGSVVCGMSVVELC